MRSHELRKLTESLGRLVNSGHLQPLLPFSALLSALLAEEGYLRSPTNECDALDAFESFRKMLELVSAAAIYEFLVARKLHPLRREDLRIECQCCYYLQTRRACPSDAYGPQYT